MLENLCAIALYKKYTSDDEPRLYYYNKNVEVDFYIPEEGMAIQASYSLDDAETKNREVGALVALHKLHPLKKAIIITYDEEETVVVNDLNIEVVPCWKWLLR